MNANFRVTLDKEDRGTIGKLDLFLLEELLVASGHIDTEYVRDLAVGFPITGTLEDGSCGVPLPGGQRVHGQPGLDGPEPIHDLKSRCYQVNRATLKAARAKTPRSSEAFGLARQAWAKVQKDIDSGFAGQPFPVVDLDLEQNSLVDTFGIYEKHAGTDWKIRLINNFTKK